MPDGYLPLPSLTCLKVRSIRWDGDGLRVSLS